MFCFARLGRKPNGTRSSATRVISWPRVGARRRRDSPAAGFGPGFQPTPVTQWRSAVFSQHSRDSRVARGRRGGRGGVTASGHRLTAWTRASWALYGGSPRGLVWPSLGRFFTRTISLI